MVLLLVHRTRMASLPLSLSQYHDHVLILHLMPQLPRNHRTAVNHSDPLDQRDDRDNRRLLLATTLPLPRSQMLLDPHPSPNLVMVVMDRIVGTERLAVDKAQLPLRAATMSHLEIDPIR